MRLSIAIGICLTTAAGCDHFPFAACAAVIERAVDVEITDARSGYWLARGASGFIRDGAFLDSLKVVGWRGSPPNDTATTLGAGLGRAGTYVVQVERPGYRTWQRNGVRVREGACGVRTARLRAALDTL